MRTTRPPRVALVLPYYDARLTLTPHQQLAAQPTLGGFAAACAAEGLPVGAFQLHPARQRFIDQGAEFNFIPSTPALRWAGRLLQQCLPRHGPAYYEPALPLWRAVGRWQPDIVHVFGLTLDLNLAIGAFSRRLTWPPLVAHYHGGQPDADRLTTWLRRQTLPLVRRVFFTAPEQAEPWIASGLLSPDRVSVVAETSTHLRRWPRALARARTGMRGEPCCLMVGRLDPIKDPVTSLTAFMLLAEWRPLAQLYIFGRGELQPVLEALVAASPGLAGRVHFRGLVPQAEMAAAYSSADLLLQASVREWSSLSVIEALACGVTPIVTDIPAFRSLTQDGTYGRLTALHAPRQMAVAALAAQRDRDRQSAALTAYFERSLSFGALARRLIAVYGEVLDEAPDMLSYPREPAPQ